MINKGFVYTRGPEDTEEATRLFCQDEKIFELTDPRWGIALMAADEHTDTIVVVLKRKEKKEAKDV